MSRRRCATAGGWSGPAAPSPAATLAGGIVGKGPGSRAGPTSGKSGEVPVRRPLVGVMGSGSEEHADLAEPLGRWLAEAGFDLLTGGGRGVMAAACRGFAAVAG